MNHLEEINLQIEDIRKKQKQLEILERNITVTNRQLAQKRRAIQDFKEVLKKEQKDVDKLTSMSFKNFFTTVFKNKDEELSREQRELLDAKMKMEHLVAEEHTLIEEHNHYINEKNSYQDDSSLLVKLLKHKEEVIKREFPQYKDKLNDLDRKIAYEKEMIIEIDEAISVGNNVMRSLNSASEALRSAANWGTWDVLGGGIISHHQKHQNIRTANSRLATARGLIRRFNKELSDIKFSGNIAGVSISSMDQTMDFWFDNIFTDMAIQNKITQGQSNVRHAQNSVRTTLNNVEALKTDKLSKIRQYEQEKEEIVGDL